MTAVVIGSDRRVVFCGDLVEESDHPAIDADSDLLAWPETLDLVIEVDGEDAAFVRRQRDWLLAQM